MPINPTFIRIYKPALYHYGATNTFINTSRIASIDKTVGECSKIIYTDENNKPREAYISNNDINGNLNLIG